jgi:hypothetical protein
MSWVCLEQLEVLSRESLHMPWQLVLTSPERSKRMGLHGIGLKFPAPISASIFSRAAALDQAAQSGKFDPWLKKVDADIDAGRVKPLNVWRQARSAARLACYQAI